jgi:hypothetical protein
MIDSTCCTSGWTQQCVDKVTSVCGETCPLQGDCVSRAPGETDSSCSGVDLTLGVPCGGAVPVCNRGNATAPAGIELVSYPAGAGEMPSLARADVLSSCNPAPGTLACSTTQPIAPGECVDVTGCSTLTSGMELMVNPAGASHIDECRCENNWSIYQTGACGEQAGTAAQSALLLRRTSLFIALDSSMSMRRSVGSPTDDQMASRWTPATNALKAFVQDPASAGLGVALRFWPDNSPAQCSDQPSCPPAGGGGCAIPLVDINLLTGDAAPGDIQEQSLVSAINAKIPTGDTPMYPALDGATAWAIDRKLAHAEEEVAVVFITDGMPTHCNTNHSAHVALAQNAFHNFGVRVHAIGFGNANGTFVKQLARAGGGRPFFMTTGASLQSSMLDALSLIRADSTACDLPLPDGGTDPSLVSVAFTPVDGDTVALSRVAGAGSCGDGWYVDPANPALARLCPATCASARAHDAVKVVAEISCH